MTDEEFKLFKNALAKKSKIVAKHRAEYAALLNTCTHNELEEKSSYFPGGYLDRSYTEHWYKCTVCGEKGVITRDDRNGSYG